MTMGLYVDKLSLPKAHIFKREPYIVAVTVTGHGTTDGRNEIQIKTEPAKGIKKDKPLTFDPPLELCPAGDVGGRIVSKVIVMESDSDFRDIGERLDPLREKIAATSLGKRLLLGLGFGSTGLALAGLHEVAELAVNRLKKSGDDVLAKIDIVLDESEANCRLGFHWDEDGAKATLRVRAALTSGDFETLPWSEDSETDLVRLVGKSGNEASIDDGFPITAPTPVGEDGERTGGRVVMANCSTPGPGITEGTPKKGRK